MNEKKPLVSGIGPGPVSGAGWDGASQTSSIDTGTGYTA